MAAKKNNSMKKTRVAVVGVGYLGKFHAQKYARMPDAELVGVVDIDENLAKQVAAENQTKAFADYRELFGKVDAASVVVPTPSHFSISRDLLIHQIDLMIEKPITTTLSEADQLIDMATSQNRLIQVGHLERFNSAVVALKDIIHKPRFIESHRLSTYKPRATDVSVVLDLMIHDIDIILNLVNSEVDHIHAAGIPVVSNYVDIANARLEFISGCVANVTASRISTKNERKMRLFQRDAYISIDFANHEATIVRKDDQADDQGLIPGLGIEKRVFDKGDALDDELRAFVRAVQTREPPPVTGEMGRDALETALDVMSQIQQNDLS
jgi:predicted dehydrogenase